MIRVRNAICVLAVSTLVLSRATPQSPRADNAASENVASLLHQLRFAEAHERIRTRLRAGDNEARFELGEALFMELKWAFERFPKPRTAPAGEIREAATYTGFLRTANGRYRLVHLPVETRNLPLVVITYWARFDYATLLDGEFGRYLNGPRPKRASTARAWRAELRRAVGFAELLPPKVLREFQIPDAAKKDLLRTISVGAALKSGNIVVPAIKQ